MTSGGSRERQSYPGKERRRAARLALVVPVEVEWEESVGTRCNEGARARNLNVHGALLHMKNYPRLGTAVRLKNSLSEETVDGRVAAIERNSDGKLEGVAVEFGAPKETFWGLTFQLQRTTLQLLEIERAFRAQEREVDFRVLHNLRDAAEYLQRMTSIVQEWQNLKNQGEDAYQVLDVLSRARAERATRLLDELRADLDAAELPTDTEDFSNLARAVDRLQERITRGPSMIRSRK
jgi:hypothetical protein